ncbi:MAG: Acg family FMN-binding oxidoreductase, partial [Hyphomicrobiales bacterium]
RRSFIRVAGSSAVIVAAGAGAFALTRTPSRALEPWSVAGTVETEPRRKALSYAILAPNPHNRQPWMVDLAGDDEIVLYCDPERLLPETDPFNRQIAIGLGCFLELLSMAAAQGGHTAVITPFPEGASGERLDHRPVARVKFEAGSAARDPLFGFVPDRRSNKEPFDPSKPVSAAKLDALKTAVASDSDITVTTDGTDAMVAKLRDLTWRAWMVETETPATYMESVRLMRIGKGEIEANPDGIDLGGPFLETLKVFGMLSREAISDPNSTAYQQGIDMYREIIDTGMAYMWLTTPSNSRFDQLQAGRAYLRLNLKATELGVSMHPISQVLQEYKEMAELYDEMDQLLQTPQGGRVQMLTRLGYGPEVPPSPRWHAATRIRTA